MLVIVVLAFGTLLSMLYVSHSLHPLIPTLSAITDVEAMEIMKADLRSRVGNNVSLFIYPVDGRSADIGAVRLPLIYYQQEHDMAYRVNETTHTIMGSCFPSLECFLSSKKVLFDSIAGRLIYFIDASYREGEKSSPIYYYIEALNGEILWAYVGEDIYPELSERALSK